MNPEPHTKYLIYIGVWLVTILLISNTVASKLIDVGPFIFSCSTLLFPLVFIFGDILTEVYGYKASRKVIWSGLGSLILMSLAYSIMTQLEPSSVWTNQEAYASVLGNVPRIALASIIAYFFGEFTNSYILSKMKIWTNGKHLWTRTIGSTIAGEGVDSIVFFVIAFGGVVTGSILFTLIWSAYVFKVAIEVVATPLTYKAITWLKHAEGIDTYDHGINYNPFSLKS